MYTANTAVCPHVPVTGNEIRLHKNSLTYKKASVVRLYKMQAVCVISTPFIPKVSVEKSRAKSLKRNLVRG